MRRNNPCYWPKWQVLLSNKKIQSCLSFSLLATPSTQSQGKNYNRLTYSYVKCALEARSSSPIISKNRMVSEKDIMFNQSLFSLVYPLILTALMGKAMSMSATHLIINPDFT